MEGPRTGNPEHVSQPVSSDEFYQLTHEFWSQFDFLEDIFCAEVLLKREVEKAVVLLSSLNDPGQHWKATLLHFLCQLRPFVFVLLQLKQKTFRDLGFKVPRVELVLCQELLHRVPKMSRFHDCLSHFRYNLPG